jgi:ankyrin repeat protein
MPISRVDVCFVFKEELDSPLHHACSMGHIDVVKELLEKGAYLNTANKYGNPPLLIACRGDHIDIIQLLLENGANVNTVGEYDYTPLHIACIKGHIEVVKGTISV